VSGNYRDRGLLGNIPRFNRAELRLASAKALCEVEDTAEAQSVELFVTTDS
jgi:hypothetical protein